MKRFTSLVLGSLLLATTFLQGAEPAFAQNLEGRILLQVDRHGEAWYIVPEDGRRFYLRDGSSAYTALESFGLGITNADLEKIPIGVDGRFSGVDSDGDTLLDTLEEAIGTNPFSQDSDGDGFSDATEVASHYDPLRPGALPIDPSLQERLKGRIVLQVETLGQAWYIHPDDGKRYFMKGGEEAYEIMRFLSLGATTETIESLTVHSDSPDTDVPPEVETPDEPVDTSEETEEVLHCALYGDRGEYFFGTYQEVLDYDSGYTDFIEMDDEENCALLLEEFYSTKFEFSNADKSCYFFDDTETYKYETAENVSGWTSRVSVSDIIECRDLSRDRYIETQEYYYDNIQVGHFYRAPNNVVLEIQDIEVDHFADYRIEVHATHWLSTDSGLVRLQPDYLWSVHVLDLINNDVGWNESFGYRMTLENIDENEEIDVTLSAVGALVHSTQEMYEDCMVAKGRESLCFGTLITPHEGQTSFSSNGFTLIGPEIADSSMQYMDQQIEVCMAEAERLTGLTRKNDQYIYFIPDPESGVFTASRIGIKYLMRPVNYSTYDIGPSECEDAVLLHELVHTMLSGSSITPSSLNEGIASKAERIDNVGNLVCHDAGYTYRDEYMDYGAINLYRQISFTEDDEIVGYNGFDLYNTAACFWNEFESLYGTDVMADALQTFVDFGDVDVKTYSIELLEDNLGLDLSYLEEKYGFTYTGENDEFSPNIGGYFIPGGGSSHGEWTRR